MSGDGKATLGGAIDRLAETIAARAGGDPKVSYTAQLTAAGVSRCAQKVGEEAVEFAIAAARGEEGALGEAADLLYHLLVAMHAAGISPGRLAEELDRRAVASGIAEKAGRTTT